MISSIIKKKGKKAWGLLKGVAGSVVPTKASGADEKPVVFVEILPREIAEIVFKSINKVSKVGCSVDDSLGFKTVDDAILAAQTTGLGLLGYVKPEDLLFFFSENLESLDSSFRDFCFKNSIPCPPHNIFASVYDEDRSRKNKSKTNPKAVVLCKVVDAKLLEKLFFPKQQEGRSRSHCYQITWGELQDLCNRLCDFGGHQGSLNPVSKEDQSNLKEVTSV